jgi:hypothetical protein
MRYTVAKHQSGKGCMMKKLLAALAGLALTTGSTLAADLGQPL